MTTVLKATLGKLIRDSRFGGFVNRTVSRVHGSIYRLSRGSYGDHIGRGKIIVLTTTGCRTGIKRTNPLTTVPLESGRYAVIGSNAGGSREPGWALNLRANPDVTIDVSGQKIPVKARLVVDVSEWDGLFQHFVDIHDDYIDYARHTTRKLPIFILEPINT